MSWKKEAGRKGDGCEEKIINFWSACQEIETGFHPSTSDLHSSMELASALKRKRMFVF